MVSINFKTEGDIKKWHIENDTVMGGVSTSKIGYLKEYGGVKGILFFQGDVSLKNDGGFAQILYENGVLNLIECAGLELKLKGDGKNYQLRIEANTTKIGYSKSFTTTSDWIIIKMAFADFKPDFHGEFVPNAPKLDLENIKNIGLLIGNNKEESFKILINEIKGY
ncbi:NADH:ubiquinone oxidoreductase [Candidatus Levyibacteriota bacterium]|nr:CIA30 family protein [Candidatus Levybacteria bacterium]GDX62276.1 NADH:ubiquinone oxidoreductase [Candidatus Levybacteria bacterium]